MVQFPYSNYYTCWCEISIDIVCMHFLYIHVIASVLPSHNEFRKTNEQIRSPFVILFVNCSVANNMPRALVATSTRTHPHVIFSYPHIYFLNFRLILFVLCHHFSLIALDTCKELFQVLGSYYRLGSSNYSTKDNKRRCSGKCHHHAIYKEWTKDTSHDDTFLSPNDI